MQSLATEFGLSETAFVVPRDEEGHWDLRWFTPAAEVRLCGHATVCAATAIWEESPSPVLTFHTVSGPLQATRKDTLVELSFPARVPKNCVVPKGLLEALGLEGVRWCGRDVDDLLLVLSREEEVVALQPDFSALKKMDTRGVIVTAPSSNDSRDFVSRFFAPRVGIDEDPVTGAAHCCLAPYWAEELQKKVLQAEQLSARGGRLEVELVGERVLLRGQSRILVRGQVVIPSH